MTGKRITLFLTAERTRSLLSFTAASGKAKGFTRFIVPAANANEASYIEGLEVFALKNLKEVVDCLTGE